MCIRDSDFVVYNASKAKVENYKELEGETIDIFINNAGFGVCGSYLETDDAREEEMIRVNVEAMRGCSALRCAGCTRQAAAPS